MARREGGEGMARGKRVMPRTRMSGAAGEHTACLHEEDIMALKVQTELNTQAINAQAKVGWTVLTAVVGTLVLYFFKIVGGEAQDARQKRAMDALVEQVSGLNRSVVELVKQREEGVRR